MFMLHCLRFVSSLLFSLLNCFSLLVIIFLIRLKCQPYSCSTVASYECFKVLRALQWKALWALCYHAVPPFVCSICSEAGRLSHWSDCAEAQPSSVRSVMFLILDEAEVFVFDTCLWFKCVNIKIKATATVTYIIVVCHWPNDFTVWYF